MVRVFISYTHDSEQHSAEVLDLAQRLRASGIESVLDQFVVGSPPEGWPLWMERQLEAADAVIMVCTTTYLRRYEADDVTGAGLGGSWESALLRDHLYVGQGQTNKVIPLIMGDAPIAVVPTPWRARYTAYRWPGDLPKLCHTLAGRPSVTPLPVAEQVVLEHPARTEPDELSDSIRRRMAELDAKVSRLTDEQLRVVEMTRFIPRLRITGNPGSGKTLVAAEKATRLADSGRRVLVLCHNPYLSTHLASLLSGTSVEVWDYCAWIGSLTLDGTDGTWTAFHEPTDDQLLAAAGSLDAGGDRYDAIIVDEGQDFRDNWWLPVEAALQPTADAELYIFGDDQQTLLPFRASYPPNMAVVDLSRNCRSAHEVWTFVRAVEPRMPEADASLVGYGGATLSVFRGRLEPTDLQTPLAWLSIHGHPRPTVVTVGLGPDDLDRLVGMEVAAGATHWQDAVRQSLDHAIRELGRVERRVKDGSNHVVALWRPNWDTEATRARVDTILQDLSDSPSPTVVDIALVAKAADLSRPTLPGSGRGGRVSMRLRENPPRLTVLGLGDGPRAATALLTVLQDGSWSNAIPEANTWTFARHPAPKAGQGTVPVFDCSEIKGLEAAAILLLVRHGADRARERVVIGASRARAHLAVLIEDRALGRLPAGVRQFAST